MSAYYNEIDSFSAAWLRELIKEGLIADGEVDERSIEDIHPGDLRSFRQHHFFAGIGVWSLACRSAGIPDDFPIWTGSCPCQPFSAAGKGGGFADERHLWPAFFHLIRARRPELVVGEQVASRDGLAWLDLVQDDMEGEGFAFRAVDTCAAGFGAPHIRQRAYWVADAGRECGAGWGDIRDLGQTAPGDESARGEWQWVRDAADDRGPDGRLADAHGGNAGAERQQRSGEQRFEPQDGGAVERVADSNREDQGGRGIQRPGQSDGAGDGTARERLEGLCAVGGVGNSAVERVGALDGQPITSGEPQVALGRSGFSDRPGPTNGLWANPDWLLCRDQKWRPVEPGTFPLADAGAFRNRIPALRGAGNSVNVAQATAFLRATV